MPPRAKIPETISGADLAYETRAKQLASLLVSGVNMTQAAKQMDMPRHKAVALSNSEECKHALLELGDTAIFHAKQRFRKRAAELENYAWDALKYQLKDEKSIQAVLAYMKVIGITEQTEAKTDTQINVVLPAGITPLTAAPTKPDVEIAPEYVEDYNERYQTEEPASNDEPTGGDGR